MVFTVRSEIGIRPTHFELGISTVDVSKIPSYEHGRRRVKSARAELAVQYLRRLCCEGLCVTPLLAFQRSIRKRRIGSSPTPIVLLLIDPNAGTRASIGDMDSILRASTGVSARIYAAYVCAARHSTPLVAAASG